MATLARGTWHDWCSPAAVRSSRSDPGDTIHTPAGEWHWHGVAPDHFMSHLAMWESLGEGQEGPETEWGEHVPDEEYRAH